MTKWMAHPHADKLESGCQLIYVNFHKWMESAITFSSWR